MKIPGLFRLHFVGGPKDGESFPVTDPDETWMFPLEPPPIPVIPMRNAAEYYRLSQELLDKPVKIEYAVYDLVERDGYRLSYRYREPKGTSHD